MRDDILRSVLADQPGKYVAVAAKRKGQWKEYISDDVEEAISWLKDQPTGSDLYWCPTKFDRDKRQKQYVSGSKYLWADLDNLDPDDLDPYPSVLWQSSPGRYQSLWKLDDTLPAKQAERLNRAMTYAVGADRSGWDLTQVLRVPGTKNYKYPRAPKGKLLHMSDEELPSDLDLDDPQGATELSGSFRDALSRNLHDIPAKTRRELTAQVANRGKRSEVLWRLVHELTEAGIEPKDIESLVRGSVWNKYTGRRDELRRLRSEIAAALERQIAPVESSRDEPPESSDQLARRVTRTPHHLFRAQSFGNHSWMVQDWWSKGSRGMIAGEPKSFKSFIAQDLALSVASGKPFLGKFEVQTPGPVLIIQAENAEWVINDRSEKIEVAKGLVGKVNFPEVTWPPDIPIDYINNQTINLLDPVDRDLVDQHIGDLQPVLTILDPLYLMFSGDINSAQELNPILTWLMGINVRHNTSLVLVHHMGKAKQGTSRRGGQRMLGSTTLHGWVESAWYIDVKTADDDPMPTLSVEREFRAAGVFPKYNLQLEIGQHGDPTYNVIHDPQLPKAKSHRVVIRQNIVAEILESEGKPLNAHQIFKHPMNDPQLSKRQIAAALEEAIKADLVRERGSRFEWVG